MENMAEALKACNQEIDLNNLDFERIYTFEEYKYINGWLKNYTLEINGHLVKLFELDENGKLVPMPQALRHREQVVAEIAQQLVNWNI
ncbi:hypothetical protein GLOIN_2v1770913 [Rhizophagus clarus]|uniref:Uncharacterized protein n=1 Tax=Rhizophagus clarus TaxID=94130 RepID=A0A8H3MIU7_9GLOM|nr:hypothetical protein GLOIN_2v1770913 [Rhizophagus clarus]